MLYFWHSNWHNFGYILEKVAKPYFLESPQEPKRAAEHAIFKFFSFLFFQISNDCCQKSHNGFRVFLGGSITSKIFLIYTFLIEKRRPFQIFLKFAQKWILFLYFFQMTFLLMIHLKWTVVYYANLNSSSINKQFLHYVEYAISFFLNGNFQNSFQDLVYCKILGCQTLWY